MVKLTLGITMVDYAFQGLCSYFEDVGEGTLEAKRDFIRSIKFRAGLMDTNHNLASIVVTLGESDEEITITIISWLRWSSPAFNPNSSRFSSISSTTGINKREGLPKLPPIVPTVNVGSLLPFSLLVLFS